MKKVIALLICLIPLTILAQNDSDVVKFNFSGYTKMTLDKSYPVRNGEALYTNKEFIILGAVYLYEDKYEVKCDFSDFSFSDIIHQTNDTIARGGGSNIKVKIFSGTDSELKMFEGSEKHGRYVCQIVLSTDKDQTLDAWSFIYQMDAYIEIENTKVIDSDSSVFADENIVEEVISSSTFMVVDDMPTYPGGDDARIRFLVQEIRYPSEALKARIQGTVYISFVVNENGSISDVAVIRGIGGGCDEEAVRVVKMMPAWNPGKQDGKPVRVQFNMPITFSLK